MAFPFFSHSFTSLNLCGSRRALLAIQYFLIIFVYHVLKDLKDSLVITGSEAGAEIIPFLKIWAMIPTAFISTYLFNLCYRRFGRKKTTTLFILLLFIAYTVFAFILFPYRKAFELTCLKHSLETLLPAGSRGFITMIVHWHFTFFYIAAEIWSMIILTALFWGSLSVVTSKDEAKKLYPLLIAFGNAACIVSGIVPSFISYASASFTSALQQLIMLIALCAFIIERISQHLTSLEEKKRTPKPIVDYRAIFSSKIAICIAVVIVGYAISSTLFEVIWKQRVREVYPTPQAFNAYLNQLTSLIGILALAFSITARWIFARVFSPLIALIPPTLMLLTSTLFFGCHYIPEITSGLIILFGSVHYVIELTSKYTFFDISKEMAFLALPQENRVAAKAAIDSLGTRLGKSFASCFYQLLLLTACIGADVVGCIIITILGLSIVATARLNKETCYEKACT